MPKGFPDFVIIIGAGAFGLSTALAINCRYPSTNITIQDHNYLHNTCFELIVEAVSPPVLGILVEVQVS